MTRRISRGVRVKQDRAPRKPALLPALLRALDARPDVTVITREWPVVFVQLRYALEKTVLNADGFSPLHRETPLFYGQAWETGHTMGTRSLVIYPVAGDFSHGGSGLDGNPDDAVAEALGPIHPEVAARLGLTASVERQEHLTGRPYQR